MGDDILDANGATDRVAFPCIHGASATHIDSLAHTFFAGKMWNGYDATALVTMQKGAQKNSVLPMKGGIVTRAVLYDIAQAQGCAVSRTGRPHLSRGHGGVGAERGLAWGRAMRWCFAGAATAGAQARSGDEGFAGFDNSILPWLKQRDVALIVWETAGYTPQPARRSVPERRAQFRPGDPGNPRARSRRSGGGERSGRRRAIAGSSC